MKTTFVNTLLSNPDQIQKEIQPLFAEYDHVKVENRVLRTTWNFYKPQEKKEEIVETKPVIKPKSVIKTPESVVQLEPIIEQPEIDKTAVKTIKKKEEISVKSKESEKESK